MSAIGNTVTLRDTDLELIEGALYDQREAIVSLLAALSALEKGIEPDASDWAMSLGKLSAALELIEITIGDGIADEVQP